MKNMIDIRLMLSKKRLIGLFVWLAVPTLLAMGLFHIFNDVTDDFTVPVGIVNDSEHEEVDNIIEQINENNLINMRSIEADEAARLVEQHELDSAFVFDNQFMDNLQNLRRSNMIESHYSNRSLAYGAIKESVGAIVQERYGLYYATNMINRVEEENDTEVSEFSEVETLIQELEEQFNLLEYEYAYYGDITPDSEQEDINIFMIWVLVSFFVTLFVFELIVSERRQKVMQRLAFTRYNMTKYFIYQVAILTILLIISDLVAWFVFEFFYEQTLSIWVVLSVRLMMILFAYMLAVLIKNVYTYLLVSVFVIIAIIIFTFVLDPLFVSMELEYLNHINPLYQFGNEEITVYWSILLIVLVALFWRVRHA